MDKMESFSAYEIGQERTGSRSGRIRLLACVALAAFAVTLAVVIGQRLSDQAMAVLAGAVCGVGASIPTSLLIVWVTRRRQDQQPAQRMQSPYPPVVVVQPPAQPSALSAQRPGYLAPYSPPAQREFTVVGGEMEEMVYYGRHQ
jgi:type IV secretory pathway protease TraF